MDIYVSNNPLVLEYAGFNSITEGLEYVRSGFMDVLIIARDLIHKGHTLRSHPLSGSIKPGETPYKTIVLTKSAGPLDPDSLRIIEECILTAEKMANREKKLSERAIKDFQLVDYTLIFGKLILKQGGNI
ncbi:MAG: GrdX family protein [Defluviitaleaceae bacterium]|nr:GrdX family protein [Defluviitaleaceae bacterium]MCL2836820.1 GrdX family protein [Defluviitaleaceae bacterium]